MPRPLRSVDSPLGAGVAARDRREPARPPRGPDPDLQCLRNPCEEATRLT